MGEKVLNQVLKHQIESSELMKWLIQPNFEGAKFPEQFTCNRSDFITYFLNYIHEEIASAINKPDSFSEISRSHSFPLDLSSEGEGIVANSTPVAKVKSDSVLLSPISPLYKHSFTTPKQKSLCLGDFIVRKASSKKKRIKPTNLSDKNGDFRSENSFNFSDVIELSVERNVLLEEKMKIATRSVHLKSFNRGCSDEVEPDPRLVTFKDEIKLLVDIYVTLLANGFVLNLTSELRFLLSLLMKKQNDSGVTPLLDDVSAAKLFHSLHNLVFFASESLQRLLPVLRQLDNSSLRLLTGNSRLRKFAPDLISALQNVSKRDRVLEIETVNNVCFNSDTDNRQNFPNDPSFHAFRKQRDLFYEILRIWELHHLATGFNYAMSLGGKIKTLLSLSNEPSNFVHFARLFKAQLLSTCRNDNCDSVANLQVDAQKLSKLQSRCVTKASFRPLNSLPEFSEFEEFFKEFIVVAANFYFNRHLADAFIEEISDLNESNFGTSALGEDDIFDVDCITKKAYYRCIRSLRILGKFLGFIESLPYKTECQYAEHLVSTHLKIRNQIRPNFDINPMLVNSIERQSIILFVPWAIKYLSMLDSLTLQLPYYMQTINTLFWIYKNFDWAPESNIYLIKFALGWFFDLPHLPDHSYLQFSVQISPKLEQNSPKFALDKLELVDQNILYFCCPYLEEIKKVLETDSTNQVRVKHITPVTAFQSPEEMARKKIEQQLEEAFFNGQPLSVRKTVEFVSERVASSCVKYVCQDLVPGQKQKSVEEFRTSVTVQDDDIDSQKVALKTKANDYALVCLTELRQLCDREVRKISSGKIEQALDSLLSIDVLPQTKTVCVGFTQKTCLDRVKQWLDSHLTTMIFLKDFNDVIQKLFDVKVARPVFGLPSGGTKPNNADTKRPADIVENYRLLLMNAIDRKVEKQALIGLLDDTLATVQGRGDVNQCILATICLQLRDLVILLLANDSDLAQNGCVLSKSCDVWRFYFNGCDDLFKSVLCPRTVKMFQLSRNADRSWKGFSRFCAYLIRQELMSVENFEEQCTGIFRNEWDEETLRQISDFFRDFVALYRGQGGNTGDFIFLLDFFSDYCEDL